LSLLLGLLQFSFEGYFRRRRFWSVRFVSIVAKRVIQTYIWVLGDLFGLDVGVKGLFFLPFFFLVLDQVWLIVLPQKIPGLNLCI